MATRAPQHGRINAHNEPSSRQGTHGSWPTEHGSGMRPPPNSLGLPHLGLRWTWEVAGPGPILTVLCQLHPPPPPHSVPGGGGQARTPIMPSPADSTNSSDNIYTMINPLLPGATHHMHRSLRSGHRNRLPKNSSNRSGISNPPRTLSETVAS